MADNAGNLLSLDIITGEPSYDGSSSKQLSLDITTGEPLYDGSSSKQLSLDIMTGEPSYDVSSSKQLSLDMEYLSQAPPITVIPDIIQRIWDTTAGWCQYTKSTFDPSPLSTETEPNHTNNLVAGTHQKIGEVL